MFSIHVPAQNHLRRLSCLSTYHLQLRTKTSAPETRARAHPPKSNSSLAPCTTSPSSSATTPPSSPFPSPSPTSLSPHLSARNSPLTSFVPVLARRWLDVHSRLRIRVGGTFLAQN